MEDLMVFCSNIIFKNHTAGHNQVKVHSISRFLLDLFVSYVAHINIAHSSFLQQKCCTEVWGQQNLIPVKEN